MSNNRGAEPQAVESSTGLADTDSSPVGQRWVGRNAMILLTIYLVLISVALVCGIIQLWPPPTGTSEASPAGNEAMFLFWTFSVSAEGHLILLVILASAVGSQAHALRSLYWYVGNRKLRFSWMMRYILMPFGGMCLGLTFYFVIRGGFFAAGTNVQDLSLYGFIAMALLVGMFTDQAVERLRRVAEALFAKPGAGIDQSPPRETSS